MIFDVYFDLLMFVYDEKKSGVIRVFERNYYCFFGDKIIFRVMVIWMWFEWRKDVIVYGFEVLNIFFKDIDESDSFEFVRNVEEM